jgi:ribonuclease H / adenosylcobalamin/alpha-ribazole phosphatase
MTATFLLIRHAMHADYGHRFTGRADGVPLSAEGKAQAQALGGRLAGMELATVYSSPRERCRATADAVAAPHRLFVRTEERLDEIDLGDWTGREIDSLKGDAAFDRWNTERGTSAPPHGEPFASVAQRAFELAAELAQSHAGSTIALVTHQDVIKALVATCLGLSLDHVLRFDIGPASVSRLVLGDWGAKLLSLNEFAAG